MVGNFDKNQVYYKTVLINKWLDLINGTPGQVTDVYKTRFEGLLQMSITFAYELQIRQFLILLTSTENFKTLRESRPGKLTVRGSMF